MTANYLSHNHEKYSSIVERIIIILKFPSLFLIITLIPIPNLSCVCADKITMKM